MQLRLWEPSVIGLRSPYGTDYFLSIQPPVSWQKHSRAWATRPCDGEIRDVLKLTKCTFAIPADLAETSSATGTSVGSPH